MSPGPLPIQTLICRSPASCATSPTRCSGNCKFEGDCAFPIFLIGGAFGLTRLMRALLFGVKPADPLVFAAVPVRLALVALLASHLPARRTITIDAAALMRHE